MENNENVVTQSVAEMLRKTSSNTATFMEHVAVHIDKLEQEVLQLQNRVAELEKQNSDLGWQVNPDRMGQ